MTLVVRKRLTVRRGFHNWLWRLWMYAPAPPAPSFSRAVAEAHTLAAGEWRQRTRLGWLLVDEIDAWNAKHGGEMTWRLL